MTFTVMYFRSSLSKRIPRNPGTLPIKTRTSNPVTNKESKILMYIFAKLPRDNGLFTTATFISCKPPIFLTDWKLYPHKLRSGPVSSRVTSEIRQSLLHAHISIKGLCRAARINRGSWLSTGSGHKTRGAARINRGPAQPLRRVISRLQDNCVSKLCSICTTPAAAIIIITHWAANEYHPTRGGRNKDNAELGQLC